MANRIEVKVCWMLLGKFVVFFLLPTSNADMASGGKVAMGVSHTLRTERQTELGPGTLAAWEGVFSSLGYVRKASLLA